MTALRPLGNLFFSGNCQGARRGCPAERLTVSMLHERTRSKGVMSLPPLNPPDPAAVAAAAAAKRRAQIVRRTASLRTLGTAGAIGALGVFTGLAAAYSPAPPKPAAIAPSVADGVVPTSRDLGAASDDGVVYDGQAAGDFFAHQSQTDPAQHQGNGTVTPSQPVPTPPRRAYVAPPRPAAPPAATSGTS